MALMPLDARLFYIGLWTRCDRQGVFEWSIKVITASLFPNDDHIDTPQVIGWLELLVRLDRVRCFEAEDKKWGFIPKFLKHQAISKSERDKKVSYPAPPKRDGPRNVLGTVPGRVPGTPDLGLPDIGRGTHDMGPRTNDNGHRTTEDKTENKSVPRIGPFVGAMQGQGKDKTEEIPERTAEEKAVIVAQFKLMEDRARSKVTA